MIRALTPLAVVAAALALRGWQLSQRTFYWDDLVIPAKFRDTGLWVPYDGHLMPGSAAVQILADTGAPLQWWLPVCLTVTATGVAGLLWWRLLAHLADRWAPRVLGLTVLMYSPFLGTASGWWSAGVNALSWQLTMAGVGLILLRPMRGGRPHVGFVPEWLARSASATVVLLGGLLMTEKALSVVPALVAVVVVLRLAGRRKAASSAATFVAPAALTAAWAILYLTVVGGGSGALAPKLDGVLTALGSSVLPGIFGGPWTWDRWNPSPAFSTTPVPVQIAVAVAVLCLAVAFLVVAGRHRRAAVGALAGSAGYLLAIFLLLREGRTGEGATDLLARGMHYYADWWSVTVLLVLAAVATRPPEPGAARTGSSGPATTRITALAVSAAFVGSSVFSTVTWVGTWSTDETGDYLAGVRRAVDEADASGTALLDQNTPLEVLTPLVTPYNTVGKVAGRLSHGSASIGAVSTVPTVVTPDGTVADADVLDISRSTQGDHPDCGVLVEAGQPQIITVEPALPFGDWTWEFTATADQPVSVQLSTPNGLEDEARWRARAVDVPVDTELTTRWVNLAGGGGTILAEIDGPPGSHVCVGAGAVGPLFAR